MCGIAGIVNMRDGLDPAALKGMVDALAHRGPDDEGFLFANGSHRKLSRAFEGPSFVPTYGLGHRRLAIIDLETGIQPLANEDGTVWITFNGEIYNHRELREELIACGHHFKTGHSDTEVIVHAYEEWGIGGFDRLNGIFAFGILDLGLSRLLLVRDQFGVKPLYYYLAEGLLVFSSEIKAMLVSGQVDRRMDIQALDDFLSFRYVPSPRTAFEQVFKIEAGGYLEFDTAKGCLRSSGSYVASETAIDRERGNSHWIRGYQEHLEQAVVRQLTSDVEVGALLSGGVDSSAICTIAQAHLDYPLRTYTVGFAEFQEGNELEQAAEFARHLGTIHTEVVIDDIDFIRALDEVAWFMDEPTATSSSIPLHYLTQRVKNDVKVVLTGQGADELFAGYPRYLGERLYRMGFRYLGGLEGLVARLPRQEQMKRAFRSFNQHDAFERLMSIYYLFSPSQKRALLKEPLRQERNPLLSRLFEQYRADDDLGRILYIDARAQLSDDFLLYSDKATMSNSIEARVPFLDQDLVRFIESMPSRLKLSWKLEGKHVHKQACKKWLPPWILKRRKRSFETPIDKWFRRDLGGQMSDHLLEGRVSLRLFNRSHVEAMIGQHRSGQEDHRGRLFALLMLEKWAQRFDVSIC